MALQPPTHHASRRAFDELCEWARLSQVTLLGPWTGGGGKFNMICAQGHRCNPAPSSVLRGKGPCRECVGTSTEAAEKAFREHPDLKDCVLIGPWGGINAPFKLICSSGHLITTLPSYLQKGRGFCKRCAWNATEKAEKAFREHPLLEGCTLIGPWKGNSTPYELVCPRGHLARPYPSAVKAGRGLCAECSGKSTEAAERAFRDHPSLVGCTFIGPWKGVHHPFELLCARGHKCAPRPGNIRSGGGPCLSCNESRGENACRVAFQKMGQSFIEQFKVTISTRKMPLRVDFCVPSVRLLVEYDGEQHFSLSWYGRKQPENRARDLDKNAWARENGYHLLRIPYGDFDHIEERIGEAVKWIEDHPSELLTPPDGYFRQYE